MLQKQGLYYDGNTGTYYYYDEASKSYQFHSQAQVTANEAAAHQSKKEQKIRKANKVEDLDYLVCKAGLKEIDSRWDIFGFRFKMT